MACDNGFWRIDYLINADGDMFTIINDEYAQVYWDLVYISKLKDKNGIYLCINDVLYNPIMGDLWIVTFKDGCYIAELSHRRDVEEPLYKVCEYMERIGNLYETPNLLQEVRS